MRQPVCLLLATACVVCTGLVPVLALHQFGEEGKVRVRGARRDALESLKKGEKDGDISEDDLRRGEKEIQAITDKKVAEIDQHIASKEKEILTV